MSRRERFMRNTIEIVPPVEMHEGKHIKPVYLRMYVTDGKNMPGPMRETVRKHLQSGACTILGGGCQEVIDSEVIKEKKRNGLDRIDDRD